MSDLITIPGEDNFETTLTQSRNGGVGDVLVNDIPTSTIASGEKSYIVVNPGKSNMQVARVSGWSSSPSKKFVVDSIAVDEGNATAYTQKAHSANSVVRFSNNYQFWKDIQTAVNSKADSSDLGAFTLVGSKIQAPGNMSFKDDNNVELTLAQIASGGGADQKVAITTNDTTTGTLNDKLLVGSGLTKTTNNPGGAETMTLAPDTNVLATKAYVDGNVSSSLIITSDYPLGEAITDITKSCVFKETAPTFAQATQAQNIGDVAGNTRVSFPAIGTGVAGNSLKLSLAKNGSPSAFLRVRIETDNAGSPSGTLVNANATKDIDPATLTTSLADTTVTFPGSFAVPQVKVHTVVSAVGDVVNASNYYKIGYSTNDTSTRSIKLWNGSAWTISYPAVEDTDNITLSTTSSSSDTPYGYRVQAKATLYINSITKSASCNATTAYIKSDAGILIATASFVGNLATFTPILVTKDDYFRIEANSGASLYTAIYNSSPTYPQSRTNIIIVGGSGDGNSTSIGGSYAWNFDSINTSNVALGFPYISSTLFHNTVLSLTDSDFSYKVALYGISTALASIGTYPKLTVFGASDNFTGMTEGGSYNLGPIPGGISGGGGTYSFTVGRARNSTKLRVKDLIS